MKNNKNLIIIAGIASLFIFVFLGVLFSYALKGLNGGVNWLNWKAFTYPLIAWVVAFPLYALYLHFKWKSKETSKLATSNWMGEVEFKELMANHNTAKELSWQSEWIAKTKLSKHKELSFASVKEPGHAVVIGSTGSGKTALLLNSNVQMLARNKDKPSFVFSDPKGELYNTHSQFLSDQGYEVLSINLRDISQSSNWNPLGRVWEMWHEDNEDAKENALNYLSELASTLFVPKGKDPFFDDGANTVFRFFVVAMLELSETNQEIKKDHMNITNVISNIQQTTYQQLQEFLKLLPQSSYAIAIAGRNIKGPETTIGNLFQTVITTLQIYNNPVIKHVTSSTNIKIDTSRPQAIFLIVPDESKAKYPFISLFVSEIYKELIGLASKEPMNTLPRRFYYLLDEFGNIPKIPQMDAMITVSRSRNIFFMLLLQNYSQLNETYGQNVANTILSNCAYEYFLLTSDIQTAQKFSQKLGEKSITQSSKSTSSHSKGSNSSISESERTRRLIHPDELMRLKFGEFVLSMQRERPIKSTLANFWEWKSFTKGAFIKTTNAKVQNYQEKHLYNFVPLVSVDKSSRLQQTYDAIFDQIKAAKGIDEQ